RERQHLEKSISAISSIENELADHLGLIELGEEEGDNGIVSEAEDALGKLHADLGRRQVAALLSGEADGNDCYLEIHAGAGGTESQDWAEMLSRMYTRWAAKKGYKVEYLEERPGEGAGIKSATFRISGNYAYGWLKTESGVHRLVRISPFDSNARRHTSFTSVFVYPEVDDSIEIEINPADLRIDTYR
ncbi:MAG: PCRF domain-containing protein, partial [Thauera sp.]|nr:PCRF domain-containing protein [Thauera sp.]